MKLAKGDKVAIVCCSNGQSLSKKKEIENLKVILEEMGLISVFSKYIYQKISLEEVENNLKGFPESGSPLEKARELMEFYEDASIKAISISLEETLPIRYFLIWIMNELPL